MVLFREEFLFYGENIIYCPYDLILSMSFVVYLLVLLGIDVHSLLGHPLTKLKFTLVFVPLWDRGRSEVAHNLHLCLWKEQWLLCQGELEPGGQNMQVQVLPTMLQQISLKGNIWLKRITKLTRTTILLDQPPPVVFSRTLSRNVSTLNLAWVELATPT